MAQRVLQYTKIIPAGTPKTAPVTLPIALDNWSIEQIDLQVQSGTADLMGFYIANNGVPWIPNSVGEFLVWNDHQESWPFTDQPTGSGWAVVGYNTGSYPHAVAVRFHVNTITPTVATNSEPTVTFVAADAPATDMVTL